MEILFLISKSNNNSILARLKLLELISRCINPIIQLFKDQEHLESPETKLQLLARVVVDPLADILKVLGEYLIYEIRYCSNVVPIRSSLILKYTKQLKELERGINSAVQVKILAEPHLIRSFSESN